MAQIHAIKMTYLKITTAAIFLFLLSCSTAKKLSTKNYSYIAYKMANRINTDGEIYVLRNQIDNCSSKIKSTIHFKKFIAYVSLKHPELANLNWGKKECDRFKWKQEKLQKELKVGNTVDVFPSNYIEFRIYEIFIAQDYVLNIWSISNNNIFYDIFVLNDNNIESIGAYIYPPGYVEGEIERETIYIDDK